MMLRFFKLLWLDGSKIVELMEITKISIIPHKEKFWGLRKFSLTKAFINFLMLFSFFVHLSQQMEFVGGITKFFGSLDHICIQGYEDETCQNGTEVEQLKGNVSGMELVLQGVNGISIRIVVLLIGVAVNTLAFYHIHFLGLGFSMRQVGQRFSKELGQSKTNVSKVIANSLHIEPVYCVLIFNCLFYFYRFRVLTCL